MNRRGSARGVPPELELKAGRKGRRRLPKFELSKSTQFLDRLEITHVDFRSLRHDRVERRTSTM